MYAIKQAMLLSGALPLADITIYYMDIRAFGKGYEQFYQTAKSMGIEFVKAKVARIDGAARWRPAWSASSGSRRTAGGRGRARPGRALRRAGSPAMTRAGSSGRPRPDGFVDIARSEARRDPTSIPGIFVAGTAAGPKDIVDTIVEASAAAAEVAAFLGPLASPKVQLPPAIVEVREMGREELAMAGARGGTPWLSNPSSPIRRSSQWARTGIGQAAAGERIGVYVCHCGGNISDVVDVDRVAARRLGLDETSRSPDTSCSCAPTRGSSRSSDDIRELRLDRVVVAACTPKLHETTFRKAVIRAGLNPYLYQPANIREQVSWAHPHDPEAATDKAIAVVRAAVAKARLLEPLEMVRVIRRPSRPRHRRRCRGLRAALDLAPQGLEVTLVEKSPFLGGHVDPAAHGLSRPRRLPARSSAA